MDKNALKSLTREILLALVDEKLDGSAKPEEKHVLKSKTIWGNIFSVVVYGALIALFPGNSDFVYLAGSGIAFNLYSIYGRITAKHKLTVKRAQKKGN